MEITVRRTAQPKPRPETSALVFGRYFTDHVFHMDYQHGRGWSDARIEPYAPLEIDPAAAALHYGQTVFEGLKAFYGTDGKIRIFRSEQHGKRLATSAERLCMPPIDSEMFVAAIDAVVSVDREWIPRDTEASLYIRPLMIATEPFLGVRPAQSYSFLILLSPVAGYYASGFAPVKIWVERERVRAARGGLGEAKTGGNYAASLGAAMRAKARGYAQVLWLDAAEHKYLEEVGTMNLFVQINGEVITPPLEGTILPGVTRDCVLRLLHDLSIPCSERRISIDEVRDAADKKKLGEVFGTGTAAVISPVGTLGLGERDIVVHNGEMGPLARKLYDTITGIQRGSVPDRYGWTKELS